MFSILRKIYLFVTHSYLFRVIIVELKYFYMGATAIADDINRKKMNKVAQIDLSGKVALVTGGARGIGTEVVKKLLECNAHVIIGCRNTKAGFESLNKIRNGGIVGGTADVLELDLASLSSVRHFSKQVLEKTDKLHILINNAGIMFPPYTLTEDGFESQWCVNYLGPFLLTHLLFPLIVKSSSDSDCRIVNVSSCAHKVCNKINYSNLDNKSNFITGVSYAYSKAAQISFTFYLNTLLQKKKLNISTFAVHPGIVNTDLFNGTLVKILMPWVFKYICKDSAEGAASILYPCLSSNLNGSSGLYLSNCRVMTPSKFTKDAAEQSFLFSFTLKQLNIKEFGCD